MLFFATLSLIASVWSAQTGDVQPAFEREGDRVEEAFRAYQEKLSTFFASVRALVEQQPASAQLPRLQDAAPAPTLYGYGVLPRIVDAAPAGSAPPVASFSYSWPATETYIRNEEIKLDQAKTDLAGIAGAAGDARTTIIANAVRNYRKLLADQRTVDQYIQYNRFWQRSIAQDRARFDQLTKVYELLTSDQPDISAAIRDVLGKPSLPSFIHANRQP